MQQKKKQEEERNALRKEVVALKIMQANYEQIVKAHQTQPGHAEARVSDEAKFQVVRIIFFGFTILSSQIFNLEILIDKRKKLFLQFQAIMDRLFQTFSNISVANFSELSACVFSWLEEHCKPQASKEN